MSLLDAFSLSNLGDPSVLLHPPHARPHIKGSPSTRGAHQAPRP